MSQAMFAAQTSARAIPEGSCVNKWQVYRDLCEAKSLLGVGDRSVAIVNALLSFYPEEELSAEHGLIVFPSNVALARRANGMTDATLRRHLASLVEAGLIIRRDSPNGKRYVRKGESKSSQEAFGFSLAPLLARAAEFHELAEQVRADRRAMHLMWRRITLYRRDIAKLLEMVREEFLPGDFDALWDRYYALLEEAPRRHSKASLELLSEALASLFEDVHNQLKTLANDTKMSGTNIIQTQRSYLILNRLLRKPGAMLRPQQSSQSLPRAIRYHLFWMPARISATTTPEESLIGEV